MKLFVRQDSCPCSCDFVEFVFILQIDGLLKSISGFQIFFSIKTGSFNKCCTTLVCTGKQNQISRKKFFNMHFANITNHHLTPLNINKLSISSHFSNGFMVHFFVGFIALVILPSLSDHRDTQDNNQGSPSCQRV